MPIVVLSQLQPRAGVALRSPPAAVRPPRIGRARAGRRRRRRSSTARIMYADKSQPADRRAGRRRADHRQAAQRSDRRGEARVHPRVHAVREPARSVHDRSVNAIPADRRARRSRRRSNRTISRDRRATSAPSRARRDRDPPGVIAVVKANAYGHGAGQVARALEDAGADLLACADIEEGAALRARRRARGDSRVRRAQRQRSRRPVRLPPDADDLDARRRARRAGGRARSYRQRVALSPEDRHRHEPARVPVRQPAAHAAGTARQPEPRARRRSTRTSRPPTIRSRRSSTSSACASSARCDIDDRGPQHASLRTTATPRAPGGSTSDRAYVHAANSAALLRDSRVWYDRVRPGCCCTASSRRRSRRRCRSTPIMTLGSRIVAVKGRAPAKVSATGSSSRRRPATSIAIVPAGYADGLDLRLAGPRRRADSRPPRADRRRGQHGHADRRTSPASTSRPATRSSSSDRQGDDRIDVREMAAQIGTHSLRDPVPDRQSDRETI